MADIKNPAPFYTLKEASTELNQLLNTDYYHSKRLLYMALAYDLKLYIYSQEWEGSYIYEVTTSAEYENYLEKIKNSSKYTEIINNRNSTLNIISFNAISSILDNGCLLEIPKEAIKIATFEKKFEFNSYLYPFNEAIYLEDALSPPSKNYLLESFKKADPIFYKEIFNHSLDPKVLDAIVDIKINGINLEKPYDGLIYARPKSCENFALDYLPPKDTDLKYFNFIINRNDILITHYQLTRIIDGTLNIRSNEYCNRQDFIARHALKKPKGKSLDKEIAQLAAKTLANCLWDQDKDKKIKIQEMANIVYRALYDAEEYRNQLPDLPISLKKWIKDIAPEYAREPGRQKEI